MLRVDFTRAYVGVAQNPRARSTKDGWSWAVGVSGSRLARGDVMTVEQIGFAGRYPKSSGEVCAFEC